MSIAIQEKPTEMQKFAKFVKEKREALGLSKADVSEKLTGNRRSRYIGEIESGQRTGITIDMMEKILKILNTELRYNEH